MKGNISLHAQFSFNVNVILFCFICTFSTFLSPDPCYREIESYDSLEIIKYKLQYISIQDIQREDRKQSTESKYEASGHRNSSFNGTRKNRFSTKKAPMEDKKQSAESKYEALQSIRQEDTKYETIEVSYDDVFIILIKHRKDFEIR